MSIANELITRGWNRGELRGDDGSVCLVGAVYEATGDDTRVLLRQYLSAVYDAIGCRRGSDVLLAPVIAAWNDIPGRTFDQVLRIAKEADETLGL